MTDVSRETFLQNFPDISPKALERLERYAGLLAEWQEKMNLVGPATIPQVWTRHFLDSAQLLRHLPDGLKNLIDIGSGAGFPGMVLAIMGVPHVNLIEATQKKARFLQAVADELGLKNVRIHAQRSEDITGIKSMIVTARAVAPLKDLIGFAFPFLNKGGQMIFLKGQHIDEELTEATKCWNFTHKKYPSLSDPSGCVLIIEKVTGAAKKKT